MRKPYTDEQVAAIVHAAQSRLQFEQGDPVPSLPWETETEHIRQSCIDGVRRARSGVTPEQHHEAWRLFKEAAGWSYGAVKDPVRKTHPCMVPYGDLPEYQKDKNRLFLLIVTALTLD
jgi:hypothetical protein